MTGKNKDKTKAQLLQELTKLRQQIARLKKPEIKYKHAGEARSQLAAIVEGSDDAIIGKTLDGTITSWNKSAEKIYGYSAQEVLGRSVSILTPPDRVDELPQIFERITRGEYVHHFDTVRMKKDGGQIDVSLSISPIKDAEGKIIGASTIARDITMRKKAERKIEHLNDVLRTIRMVNQFITMEKDRDRILQGVCNALIKNRGYYSSWINLMDNAGRLVMSAEAGSGDNFFSSAKCLKRGDLPDCAQKALSQSDVVAIADPLSTCSDCAQSGKYHNRGMMTVRLEYSKKIYGLLGVQVAREFVKDKEEQGLFKEVAGDISFALHEAELEKERKKAEEQIKASLKEKEALLQEIHHRVKNNMQIISSLIKLQSKHITDEKALETFRSAQDRIKSMALVHEGLYRSKDFARVDFNEYIRSLMTHLLSAHKIDSKAIKLNIDIKDIFLNINTAIPCGLIINELASNSLKYAFPAGKKGEIKIAMHPLKGKEIELIVSDNGVGLPKDVDFRSTESLGLYLVTLLAEDQLHGDIVLNRDNGTEFQIRIREAKS